MVFIFTYILVHFYGFHDPLNIHPRPMDPIGESPTGFWAHLLGEVGTNLLGFGCDHSGVLPSTAWVSWNISISVAAGCWGRSACTCNDLWIPNICIHIYI